MDAMGRVRSPQHPYVEVLTLLQIETVFGDRIFKGQFSLNEVVRVDTNPI